MARVIEGERGGKLLIYQGYKYARNRMRGLAIYWRCSRQGCSTALISNVFDLEGLAAHNRQTCRRAQTLAGGQFDRGTRGG